MIDSLASITSTTAQPETIKVLRMVKNERMGGSVPVWETVEMNAQQKAERDLALAQRGENISTFDAALAYQQTQQHTPAASEEFSFDDIIDMINPLHHIPVVGHVYRKLTGDEIKPIGQIIGGAMFGGPAGAAVGLVNTVIREETGNDVAGNAYSMVAHGKMPTFKNQNINQPERALSQAAQLSGKTQEVIYDDLPAALLAYTPTAYSQNTRTYNS